MRPHGAGALRILIDLFGRWFQQKVRDHQNFPNELHRIPSRPAALAGDFEFARLRQFQNRAQLGKDGPLAFVNMNGPAVPLAPGLRRNVYLGHALRRRHAPGRA